MGASTRPINKFWDVVFGAGLPRLPAAGDLHDRGKGKTVRLHKHDPLLRGARDRPTVRVPSRLSAAPANSRAIDRVADPRQPQAPMPRRGQQRRVAAPPDRGPLNLARLFALGPTRRNGSGCWPELNAAIEDRLTRTASRTRHQPDGQNPPRSGTRRPTGPQRRTTRGLCRQLEGPTLSIYSAVS